MDKPTILIAGGGFAGLSALRTLKTAYHNFNVVLISKGRYQEFLPMLPDIIGKDFPPTCMQVDLEHECKIAHAQFIQSTIQHIKPDEKIVQVDSGNHHYDYLILTAGAKTNFYGNDNFKNIAFELKDIADAISLRQNILEDKRKNIVVSGGGYTGVEAASAIWLALKKNNLDKNIFLVNRGERLCSALEEKFSDYVTAELQRCGINLLPGTTVQSVEWDTLTLDNGSTISDALLLWVAGVKAPGFIMDLNKENNGSRLPVNAMLQHSDYIYVAGDCAEFTYKGKVLRMSVQNAISEGALAAKNILRHNRGETLKKYIPFDPGYVLPLASGKSCGRVMGIPVFGKIPGWLHYLICSLRSSTTSNGWKVFRRWMGI